MTNLNLQQKRQIAAECVNQEAEKPGSGRGWERRAAVIQYFIELWRPSYKGVKVPMWLWRIISHYLAREISKWIDKLITLWINRHGVAWIKTPRSRLIKEAETAASVG